MTNAAAEPATYYPPPESQGGWRWLQEPEEVRTLAGVTSFPPSTWWWLASAQGRQPGMKGG